MLTALLFTLLLVFSINGQSSAAKKKVCVIGAGPAGLASVKQLSSRIEEFEPIVFEKNSDVGGLWIYSDTATTDKHGLPVHSGVYQNMRITLPKELLVFPDYRKFSRGKRSFVTHEYVLEYLRNYTLHFNLYQYIQFDTLVEKVRPIVENRDRQTQWHIQSRNLNTNETNELTCDAVMVCTGNFFKPLIPEITGMSNFTGRVLHSHSYRQPEDFTNETVVVLGAGPSGTDISNELNNYAKLVYLSHRHDKISGAPANVVQVHGVVAAEKNVLILSNGSRITADVLVYCTGYEYDFPVLDATSGIVVDNGKYVHPLYKHLVNIEHLSMSFVGLIADSSGFSIFQVQARYFVSLLQGKVKLPSYDVMLREAELPKNVSKSKAHLLGEAQWAYYDDLAEDAGFEPLPSFYARCHLELLAFHENHQFSYKDSNLLVLDDGSIRFVELNTSANV